MLSFIVLSVVKSAMLSSVKLSVDYAECHILLAECHCAECRHVVCRGALRWPFRARGMEMPRKQNKNETKLRKNKIILQNNFLNNYFYLKHFIILLCFPLFNKKAF